MKLCLLAFSFVGLLSAQSDKNIDFSRLVVVGDSLAAGAENGSLVDFQQIHGFANVIAHQAHARLVLPLVPYPGAPNTLELVSANFPPVIKPVSGTLIFPRLNPLEQATDLAVPFQTLSDALDRKPNRNLQSNDQTQLATNLVLGFPCPILFACPEKSQVDEAVALKPTTIIVEIGSNDVLAPLSSGKFRTLISSPQALQDFISNFGVQYNTLLTRLATTNATLIVGNLPDITTTAYLIPLSKLAAQVQLQPDQLASILGLSAADYVTLDAIPTVDAILTNARSGPLPASCSATTNVLCYVTASEAAVFRQVVIQLNTLIAAQVQAHGAVLVDFFSLTDRLAADGYTVGGVTLTTDFLGGLYSLDGLHPSNTGYAIMANEFIAAINTAFDTSIPDADVLEVAEHDPLVLTHPKLD